MQRRGLPIFVLLGLSVVALLLAGCGGEGKAPAIEAKFVFVVDQGVEEGDRAIIERVLTDVRAFYVSEAGHDIQHDVTVTVRSGATLTGKTAYGSYGSIEIYTGGPAWTQARYQGAEAANAALIAHEYFHTLQNDLIVGSGSANRSLSISPGWMLEGSAELAAYKYTEHKGYVTMQNAVDYYTTIVGSTPQPRLGTVVVNSQANYAQAFLAVERLGRKHDLRTFAKYFTDTGSMDWRQAFARNFGMDVEAFIDSLEQTPAGTKP